MIPLTGYYLIAKLLSPFSPHLLRNSPQFHVAILRAKEKTKHFEHSIILQTHTYKGKGVEDKTTATPFMP